MIAFLKTLFGMQPVDYKQLYTDGAVIVDVRTPAEYKAGHVKGSINIPLDSIRSKSTDLKKRNRAVITCCQSGGRSSLAKRVLQSAGVECYNGGSWNALQKKLS
ncbi:rhodanese-like domain-containing protein [Panacibacter sp. DH6]|uniref:Rhodanese-like domain-containing protein n=1 Tax=Panacibacter microcysteis TaxID=2793269 RepID=A0A931E584_9BACT|nr:rhodanese-like domain-containing protein [Panacibacter microcysteis]MBG9374649.1 rhodanese-like domain-containing protein [Panacibacter microcysteis]